MKIYNDTILKLSANITHIGLLKNADIYGFAKSKICGSKIDVSLKLDKGIIKEFGQEVNSCLLGQASCAILAQFIVGYNYDKLIIAKEILNNILQNKTINKIPAELEKLKIFEIAQSYKEKHEAILLPYTACINAYNNRNKKA